MAVAASVLPPLTENCGAGAFAMASLNVAVIVNRLPGFAELAGEYVRAAVGTVLSTSTLLVSGAVKLRLALRADASLIVPPFKPIGDATAMPSESFSPAATV